MKLKRAGFGVLGGCLNLNCVCVSCRTVRGGGGLQASCFSTPNLCAVCYLYMVVIIKFNGGRFSVCCDPEHRAVSVEHGCSSVCFEDWAFEVFCFQHGCLELCLQLRPAARVLYRVALFSRSLGSHGLHLTVCTASTETLRFPLVPKVEVANDRHDAALFVVR